tara:strand:- start:135 stop:1079 length:945 start_codon:yes stop_codon:yes gene_type:complete
MINWGILGFGRMGLTFANAIEETTNSKLVCVASKSGKKFKEFKNFSYEDLIHNNNVDAIYISTLNNTHIDLIKNISKTGKKILCEKPVSLSLESLIEVERSIVKKKIQFYEAIAYYSHPQTLEVLNLIKENEIGEIINIECNFGFKARFKPDSRLFNESLGGGSIYDLGCYPISFFLLFAKDYNKISIASKSLNYAESGVDDEANLILNYDNKFEGRLNISLKSQLNNNCIINCTNGYIKINEPWFPAKKTNIETSINGHYFIKTINSNLSVYANQIQNVSESFKNNNKNNNLFDINKSISNMKLIENWLKKEN